MANEFRPFVLAVGKPHYRSQSVNIDRLGLREQYDSDGRFINIDTMKYDYERCNIIVGGSTVFGVDATSDKTTLGARLTEPGVPCINLGVRGALSQQELILFHQIKRFLPPIDNIILMTGINNCSIAFLPDSLFYPDYGGVFSEQYYYNTFYQDLQNQYDLLYNPPVKGVYTRQRFLEWVNTHIYNRFASVRRWATRRFETECTPPARKPTIPTRPKLELMLDFARNDIQTWGCIQQGLKNKDGQPTRVHVVLQPCIGWTTKKLTQLEQELFDADAALTETMRQYTTPDIHEQCVQAYEQAARDAGLDFHDANTWLNDPKYTPIELFTDVCHLTDEGSVIVANLLKQHLSLTLPPMCHGIQEEAMTVCSR